MSLYSHEGHLKVDLTVSLDVVQFSTLLQLFTLTATNTHTKLEAILAAIDDLQKAQAAEKADLATLSGLITQLLTAFANGTMTAAQASALLTEMNAEDSTIQGNITSIQTALAPPPATPATPTA